MVLKAEIRQPAGSQPAAFAHLWFCPINLHELKRVLLEQTHANAPWFFLTGVPWQPPSFPIQDQEPIPLRSVISTSGVDNPGVWFGPPPPPHPSVGRRPRDAGTKGEAIGTTATQRLRVLAGKGSVSILTVGSYYSNWFRSDLFQNPASS